MAPRRKLRQREAELAFEALSIEGGLISPEWLARVAQLNAGHQAEADYRIPKGLNLRDEIGRYWRIAQAYWADFDRSCAAGTAGKPTTEQFVATLLKECLGFGSLTAQPPVTKGERTYPLDWTALEGRVPVIIVAPRPPAGGDERSAVDDLTPDLGDAGRRRSAFGLAQEYLNAEGDALWGVVSDGLTLRLCRDNASLTRPAWIEADLDRIFREERYADFAAFWLLAHETRFGAPGQPASTSHLEAWRAAGREEGTRAHEFLRDGVEQALVALGKGFLAHPDNQSLRAALHDNEVTKDAYFQELLRLVYRLIFLLTAEERGLLHPEGVPDDVKARYAQGYGVRRLRDRAVKRSAHDRFGDLWEALKIVFRGVAAGELRLGLPALGGLFASDQCPHLDAARLENRSLLTAIFRLSWLKGESGLARVNWRDKGPEEMGSVYESLLELVPVIPADHRSFSFATGDETKGNARKTTGSYYTPDSLVQVLLDSALEPVVKEVIARNPQDPAEALLRLTVVDPACGSGHFLLAAAQRLAAHLARLLANGTPSAAEYRHALRQVVSRCLFGVDLNPMAVELCRVSLWMEAVEPGRPLSFLDSHIQRGNALFGATPELMAKGIPDAAWEPIEGDDRKTASILKKRNRVAAEGQRPFDLSQPAAGKDESAEVAKAATALDEAPDADLTAVAGKEARWEEIQASHSFQHQRFVADAWCAAFVWPKPPGETRKSAPLIDAAPTNEIWRQIRDERGFPSITRETVEGLAERYHFFHWHLAFPQVFARGGFDVVVGNPPWEKVKLQEKEWFASRIPEIGASSPAKRKKMIAELERNTPSVYADLLAARRSAEGQSHFPRAAGRFPLCARGDINSYALFAELGLDIRSGNGRVGLVVPSGIATDDTYKDFFQEIVKGHTLVSFWDFENRLELFPGVDSRMKFALLTMGTQLAAAKPQFAFFLHAPLDLRGPGRVLELDAEDIAAVNPVSRTCPIFRTRRDADIALGAYKRVPILRPEGSDQDGWGAKLHQLFHMTNDADLFKPIDAEPPEGWLPVYEGKMIDAFDHRSASIEFRPENALRQQQPVLANITQKRNPAWTPTAYQCGPEAEVVARCPPEWPFKWFIGFKRVTASTNERTLVGSVVPWSAVSYTLYVVTMRNASAELCAALLANLNSLVCDYFVRQKTAQPSLPAGCIYESPVLRRQAFLARPSWLKAPTLVEWIVPRVVELTYTATDVTAFARDLGWSGRPFSWDPARRAALRAELDGVFLHLYGISRQDADYILDSFRALQRSEERECGTFRTKSAVLNVYEAMAAAQAAGTTYSSDLRPLGKQE